MAKRVGERGWRAPSDAGRGGWHGDARQGGAPPTGALDPSGGRGHRRRRARPAPPRPLVDCGRRTCWRARMCVQLRGRGVALTAHPCALWIVRIVRPAPAAGVCVARLGRAGILRGCVCRARGGRLELGLAGARGRRAADRERPRRGRLCRRGRRPSPRPCLSPHCTAIRPRAPSPSSWAWPAPWRRPPNAVRRDASLQARDADRVRTRPGAGRGRAEVPPRCDIRISSADHVAPQPHRPPPKKTTRARARRQLSGVRHAALPCTVPISARADLCTAPISARADLCTTPISARADLCTAPISALSRSLRVPISARAVAAHAGDTSARSGASVAAAASALS